MNVEEVIVHTLNLIVTLVIIVILFQVWKYLNSKPLGIQTVLDDFTKDGMVILGLNLTHTWITWIKFMAQYNYYVALTILKMEVFFKVALIVQAMTFSITKYLFIFKFQNINNIADGKIKLSSRICVASLAMSCATFDDWTTAKKVLYLTTENQINKELTLHGPRPLFSSIVAIFSILTIAIVQAKIAYKRWKYPEFQNNVVECDTYNFKTISIAVGISLTIVVIIIFSVHTKSILLTSLITLLNIRFIALISMLLMIYSNQRMFAFIKKSLMALIVNPEPNTPENPLPNEAPDPLPIQPHSSQNCQTTQVQSPIILPQSMNNTPNEGAEMPSLAIARKFCNQNHFLPDVYI